LNSQAVPGHFLGSNSSPIGLLPRFEKEVIWIFLVQISCATGDGGESSSPSLTRFTQHMLFGVKPIDPLTFAGVSMVLVLVAMLACYFPARRSSRIDPMEALRYE
jgi:putative ABC transport system permease protein